MSESLLETRKAPARLDVQKRVQVIQYLQSRTDLEEHFATEVAQMATEHFGFPVSASSLRDLAKCLGLKFKSRSVGCRCDSNEEIKQMREHIRLLSVCVRDIVSGDIDGVMINVSLQRIQEEIATQEAKYK